MHDDRFLYSSKLTLQQFGLEMFGTQTLELFGTSEPQNFYSEPGASASNLHLEPLELADLSHVSSQLEI